MSNMSYCRWENTLSDFQDCVENAHDNDLSETEEASRLELIEAAVTLLCERSDLLTPEQNTRLAAGMGFSIDE